jgi:hypothetical protein
MDILESLQVVIVVIVVVVFSEFVFFGRVINVVEEKILTVKMLLIIALNVILL